MTATQTPTIQTETSPPPAGRPAPPRRRRTLLAAALVVIAAAVALTVWLLTNGAPSQTGPITPISAPAPPQQAAPDQADAGTKVGSVDASGGYAQFCQGSPTLCGAPAAPALPQAGYLQFCQGSPTLCGAPSAPKPPNSGYVLFCENSPMLCTKPN